MKCDYCEIVEQKTNASILYEDSDTLIVVKDMVLTPGQITVIPKQHFTIVEMIPPKLLQKCSLLANKVSIASFDTLGIQGTNIIIQNGLAGGQKVPHVALEIIPRKENDTLPLQWQPKPLSEVDLETTFTALQDELKREHKQQPATPEANLPSQEPSSELASKFPSKSKESPAPDSYLLKSLKRLP